MTPIHPTQVLDALRWRYATKRFDPARTIDPGTWAALEETLVLSPSSFGLQPWKFLIVTDPQLREALVPLAWGQRQVAEASHLVVFAVKHPMTATDVRRHIEHTAETHEISPDTLAGLERMVTGFLEKPPYPLDLREWSSRQVYIALGTFLTAAALMGIDTCPMEGLDPAGFDHVLGLENSGYFTVAACPVGYRAAEDHTATRTKVRFPKESVLQRVGG